MAEVLLFHHAQGRTAGVLAFAEDLRRAGHLVHVPDLYGGRVFARLEDGVGYAREVGFRGIVERGVLAVEGLPERLVYAGMSLGALPAQKLAQTRAGAVGAVFLHACLPADAFGGFWPEGARIQVHGMKADPSFALEGDLEAARTLVASVPGTELFLYPGDRHLFTDRSLPDYDSAAAGSVMERVTGFLAGIR
jgi:dienelactone hydrolase